MTLRKVRHKRAIALGEVVMDAISLRAVFFKDGDWYSAQCLEYDIGAQAKTLKDLRHELQRVIITHLMINHEMGLKAFENLEPAPQKYWEMYTNAETEINPVDSDDFPFRMPDPSMFNPVPKYRLFEDYHAA